MGFVCVQDELPLPFTKASNKLDCILILVGWASLADFMYKLNVFKQQFKIKPATRTVKLL